MDKEYIKKLAENPNLIPGIYNYCDRWCERCPFTYRCMNFALSEEQFTDPQTHDINNEAFWDFLPTAAELAGLPEPKGIDGISVLPTLLGKKQKKHKYLYWDYGHVRKTFKQAVRMGKYKALKITDKPIELYDLEKDPGETKNIAAQHPKVVAKIENIMTKALGASEDYRINAESQRY